MLLAGPPGIGKTRFAREIADVWGSSDGEVAWIAGTETARPYPFAAFAALDGSLEPEDFGGSARRILERLRTSSITLCVVDDAHLLDDASATLVHQLALPNPGLPTVLTTISRWVALPDAVAALDKDGLLEVTELEPLSERAVAEMVHDMLGGEVEGRTAERLYQLSEGNPRTVAEMVDALSGDGRFEERKAVWSWRGELPPSPRLNNLLPLHLDGLEPDVRRILEVLSLAGPLGWSRLVAFGGPEAVRWAESDGLIAADRHDRRIEFRVVKPLWSELIRAGLGPAARMTIMSDLDALLDQTAGARSADRLLRAQIRLDLPERHPEDAALFTEASRLARPDHALAERFARAALDLGGGFTAADYLVDALLWQGRFEEAQEIAANLGEELTPEERDYFSLRWYRMAWWMTGLQPDHSDLYPSPDENRVESDAAASTARQSAMAAVAGHGKQVLPAATRLLDDVGLEDEAVCWATGAALIGLGGCGRVAEALALMPRAYGSTLRLTDFNYRLLLSILDSRLRRLSGDLAGARTVLDALRGALGTNVSPNPGLVALAEGELVLAEGRPGGATRPLRAAVEALDEVDFGGLSALARCRLGQALTLGGDTTGALDLDARAAGGEERILDLFRPELLVAKAWILVGSGNRKAGGRLFDRAATSAAQQDDQLVELHARHAA
ncbi:MAG: hypothetical protein JO368_07050, partial [Acidimicrobiales bacterium]|nr:hypothetical protein [Acidimicrobiales bacterium]